MYRGIPRLRASGSSLANFLTAAQLKRKASNSLSAVQDTFYSTKDIFERHRVVFTISTSIASVATAWAGYSIRHYHESRVDQRLEAIEKAVLNCSALDNKVLNCSGKRHFIMKSSYQIQDPELKRLVSGTVSFPAFLATAGTSLIIGYGLGWRGGAWYTNRKLRREQLKLLGQIKPRRWPLKFLRRPLMKLRQQEPSSNISEPLPKDASAATTI
ncbi:uncharacterized protein LOC127254468 isoform X2 [Andrographis paniculata]|uniref:uncharacterized protein LOC127254468 isoform X2 n=1 Tax=Andrographis paniculata TaxID=175694 RepID=UPI0021E8AA39|nr:uncharacterized protein LOC127254468 isoform X2 [Andrographis paniculata]